MKYKLEVFESNSKLAAVFCAFLQPGRAGDLLILKGFSQSNLADVYALMAERMFAAGKTREDLANVYRSFCAGNAAQQRQLSEKLNLTVYKDENDEKGTLMTLDSYWRKNTAKAEVATADVC